MSAATSASVSATAWPPGSTTPPFGKVRNDLGAADRPAPGEDTVELKARTAHGDIAIRHAAAHSTQAA